MSPAKLTARRLVSGGVLFTALGAIGLMSALPATADQLVWGNAQAWVADGDAVTGYSTATGFGGETEGSATTRDVFGPVAPYLEIDGESHTVVDDEGARATSTVRTVLFRMDVADLAAHGLIDVPPDVELPEPSSSPPPSPEGEPTEDEGDTSPQDGPSPGEGDDNSDTNGTDDDGAPEEENGTDGEDSDAGEGADDDQDGESEASDAPSDAPEREPREDDPSASESPAVGEEVLDLAPTAVDLVSSDDNAVEFTLADVTTTASAQFDGTTEATLAHGEMTAFGVPVGSLEAEDDGLVAQDVLEVFDEDGEVALEVPVSIRVVANETTFQDEDSDWEGEGIRSWMTVWVQVGEADEEQGFAVDFADSWTLGSAYASTTPPDPSDKGGQNEGGEETEVPEDTAGSDGRLATTGSSLAALVTAAVVAVGGGSAATFLARKRTTAMDDQID